MNWNPIGKFDEDLLLAQRNDYHHIVQVLAAVGRNFFEKDDEDLFGALNWVNLGDGSIVCHWVKSENREMRFGLSLSHGKLFVQDHQQILSDISVSGKTFQDLMLWAEEQLGRQGLSTTTLSADIPYEIEGFPAKRSFEFRDEAAQTLSSFYANAYTLLRQIAQSYHQDVKVEIWPHHFDQALLVLLKDSGDTETSTFIGAGFSPGDNFYGIPYFYVNSWPYVEEQDLAELNIGKWHREDWIGAVLDVREIAGLTGQKAQTLRFVTDVLNRFQHSLTR